MLRKCFFLIIFVIHLCCSKDNGVGLDINGRWELVSASSMLGGTTYQPGNGNILSIKSNGEVEKMEPSAPTKYGRYTLSKKGDCNTDPARNNQVIVTFEYPGLRDQNFVSLTDDKMYLNSEVCVSDGGHLVYQKI